MEFELEFEFESEIEFSFEIEFEPNAPASEKILSVPDRSIFRSKMDSRMSPTWTPECLQNLGRSATEAQLGLEFEVEIECDFGFGHPGKCSQTPL